MAGGYTCLSYFSYICIMLTYKRKLKLTKVQEQRISSWIGACRFVYNMGLEIKIEAYKNKQVNVS